MTKLGDMFHIPVTDRLNKRRPCVQKTIGRSGTLFCHFLLILVQCANCALGQDCQLQRRTWCAELDELGLLAPVQVPRIKQAPDRPRSSGYLQLMQELAGVLC
jgi:hypothetical protein